MDLIRRISPSLQKTSHSPKKIEVQLWNLPHERTIEANNNLNLMIGTNILSRLSNTFLAVAVMAVATFHSAHAQAPLSEGAIVALNEVQEPENDFIMISMENRDDAYVSTDMLVIASEWTDPDCNTCLLAKHPRGVTFSPFKEKIKYFRPEKGYEYIIEYRLTDYKKKRLKDEYELLRVLSKEKKDSDIRKNHEKGTFEETSWDIVWFIGEEPGGGMTISEEYIYFSTGCNSVSGVKFDVDQDEGEVNFDFSNSMMTEMGCVGDGSGLSPYFLENNIPVELPKVNRYEATGRQLKLFQGDKLIMELKR